MALAAAARIVEHAQRPCARVDEPSLLHLRESQAQRLDQDGLMRVPVSCAVVCVIAINTDLLVGFTQ